ncbi:recombinase family protein [Leptothermofonsia sp. ETS-13]|uniref:recombinase family protein n=1 Tax=Leptothermofonsia sp. ETS-13 TaxID=3035696 RepID=UPI003B9E2F92
MNGESVWITGPTRSGKTSRLVELFREWMEGHRQWIGSSQVSRGQKLGAQPSTPGFLVLAAIGDNRIDLVDRLTVATQSRYPFHSTTPLGFFQDEVLLFWPLLIQQLDLKAQFPLRLAPENEQELASRLWQPELDRVLAQQSSLIAARMVRRSLDLLQLASLAGIPISDIPSILEQGLGGQVDELPLPPGEIGELLQRWQHWCLERGLLTYGILAGLYWQYLLPNPTYQEHLVQRYQWVLADDVDEYPAIARSLFEALLDGGVTGAFTFNPNGAVRLGLGADPNYLAELANRCRVEELTESPVPSLGKEFGTSVVELVMNPVFFASLPESIQTIQTTSRAQLLQQIAEVIIEAVQVGQVEPREIAIIGPGLDAIARYSLIESLTQHQIFVESLNDQRPLTSSPIIRALLTLLTLVYPGLGRLVNRDAIAEMLVVLSGYRGQRTGSGTDVAIEANSKLKIQNLHHPLIDPVRAGLLADYCFAPHPEHPRLLPANTFPRWDRLGYQVTAAYEDIVQWISTQQAQLEQRLIPNAVSLLDRAIQFFLLGGGTLPFDQLSALRQLIETAQHYWEVNSRLKSRERYESPAYMTVSRFIQLLNSGTVTANPYPVRPMGPASNAVTLATVFQYRSNRRAHRWQFWLDAGSPRWLSGIDALFGAPLFLHEWSGRAWTAVDAMESNERRLRRILLDLLGRTAEKVYLCHSDLATNGQEQTGVLLSLVNVAVPYQ